MSQNISYLVTITTLKSKKEDVIFVTLAIFDFLMVVVVVIVMIVTVVMIIVAIVAISA